MSISVIMICAIMIINFSLIMNSQTQFCLNVFAQARMQRLSILLVGFQTSVSMLNASLVV